MDRHTWTRLLGILGAGTLAAGSVLPWARFNPAWDGPVIMIYLESMDTGFKGLPEFGLGLAAVVFLVTLAPDRIRLTRRVNTLIGIGVVAMALLYLTTYSPYVGYGMARIPAVGWYATLVSGIVMMIAGARHLPAHIWNRSDAIRATDNRLGNQ